MAIKSKTIMDTEPDWIDHHTTNKSGSVVSLLFTCGASTLAGLTLLTHLAQLSHLPFRWYAYLALGMILVIPVLTFLFFRNGSAPKKNQDTKILILVLCIGLAGSAVTLVANRPDADDYYYVPNAVYYLHNPDARMGFEIHYLYSGGEPFTSTTWATAGAFEYIQAVAAFFLHINYLSIYYLFSTAISGFLIPLALFLLILCFSKNSASATAGSLISVGLILLLGETHRTFGNLSFVRIFQGKVVLLAIGLPLFTAFTIHYFARPGRKAWLRLLVTGTALTGTTASAAVLLPCLAIALAAASLFSGRPTRARLSSCLMYFLSLLYTALFALYALTHTTGELSADSPANSGWPDTFGGHLSFFINPIAPLTPILVITSTILCLVLVQGKQRRFLIAWIITILVLFLNPWIAPLLIRYVTSPNAYWRLFYILPFPLVGGVAASLLYEKMGRFKPRKRIALVTLVCTILIVLNLTLPSSALMRSNVSLGLPGYKLSADALENARQITTTAQPGVMLAPEPIAGIVSLLSADFPQMRLRKDAERVWLYAQGRQEEAELRLKASDFLDGLNNDPLPLHLLVEQYGDEMQSLVILKSVYNSDVSLQIFLTQYGFFYLLEAGDYFIACR